MEKLAAVDPANRTYQKELSTVLAWLADAQRSLGRLDAAIAVRERQIALLDRAVASGATDVQFRQELIPAHQALGNLLTSRGQSQQGIEEFRSAVAGADRLVPVEPGNSYWKTLAAGAKLDLARTLLSLGHRDEAAQQTAAGCTIIVALRSSDGQVRSRQTMCFTMRSRLALQSGAHAPALAFAEQSLASASNERSGDAVKDRYAIAAAWRLLGDARKSSGDADGAIAAWSKGLSALPQAVAERPQEMDEHATILQRLGRSSDAQQLAARLSAMGYRRLT